MARQRIEHRATTAADPATVYALLRNGATWPEWGPIDSFELERPGADEPEGVGAVRLLRGGRVTGRDTIVELVPDRRFAYTHRSNLPVKNYRGEVDLTPVDGGTEIRLREGDYADRASRDKHAGGWPRFLNRLESLLATTGG